LQLQKESLSDQTGVLEKLYSGTSKRTATGFEKHFQESTSRENECDPQIRVNPLCKGLKAHLSGQGKQR
jgi:hypothetical protein